MRYLSWLLIGLLSLSPLTATAACARDTASAQQTSAASSKTLFYSFTVTGANPYLEVYVFEGGGPDITDVEYASTTMTQLANVQRGSPDLGAWLFAYGLANPATGAHNVAITRSGTTDLMQSAAIDYTGVNQVTFPIDATSTTKGSGTASTISTNITTTANNTCVSGFGTLDNGSVVAGTGATLVTSLPTRALAMFESTALPLTPAGTYTYALNGASSAGNSIMAIALAPLVTTPAYVNGLKWDIQFAF